ncbi:ubiquinol-cytochrome c reductase iron-sulfur subunit [Roseomonas sp. SSH11]|uniref:Ubiquinol-cytochrome c reductase iron-sulfur subunit n=1 Tax=Pararoseomonas baculiformis TaxID=2820812 RepID=A0ABS4A943_9PROT|nr:ubiquinol-cytochrome c reductase iron-sulfur subunit [Pararoseomonas baculiformis]MBP0443396.1 ubiquinol-cytochrome c reductase iron-sulfur subunit [Pararoseomonas baculiformis]
MADVLANLPKTSPSGPGPGHVDPAHGEGPVRRDFLKLAAGSFAAVGTVVMAWPFIHSMNPSQDVLALASTEVDLTPIAEGQAVTVMWRGKPVFVRRRTPQEIQEARSVPVSELRDPATDQSRVKAGKEQWLVVLGVCTHLGCVPLGQKPTDARGDYGGWFCPCHGSHYDTAGRIRRGPAPTNLAIPDYSFTSDTRIRVG